MEWLNCIKRMPQNIFFPQTEDVDQEKALASGCGNWELDRHRDVVTGNLIRENKIHFGL